MEYRPRYAQPFTLAEAAGLDVSIITDEIARLQNSLKHLRETQVLLREYQSTETPETVDLEVQKALAENDVVIGSQTERISILRMALEEKGIISSSHYDVSSSPPTMADTHPRTQTQNNETRNPMSTDPSDVHQGTGEDVGVGLHL